MDKFVVGIADMKMARNEGTLITYALGSCIGVCLYDPGIKLGALVHIMLPINMEANRSTPMKYADTGIRQTLAQMVSKGAVKSRIVAKIAGGARMFDVPGNGSLGNIGQRNIESVLMTLQREKVHVQRQDVGGKIARTLLFDVQTGQALVRVYGKDQMIL